MKKTGNNRILVYSRKSEDLLNGWKRSNRHINNDYEFVSNAIDLSSRLSRKRYKMTIIDAESGDNDNELLKAISAAVASGQPITIRRLHKENQEKPSGKKPDRIKVEGKTELSTIYSRVEDGDDNERNIVSAVTATLKHQINNPLMAISANVEMILKNNSNLGRDLIGKIEQIGLCTEKIKEITERLTNLEQINIIDTAAGRMIDLEHTGQESENPRRMPAGQPSE